MEKKHRMLEVFKGNIGSQMNIFCRSKNPNCKKRAKVTRAADGIHRVTYSARQSSEISLLSITMSSMKKEIR